MPAKMRVFINAFAIGRETRDPEIWEKPLEYSPERFKTAGDDIGLKDHDYRVLPFGGGRRGCPGDAFAQPTIQATLASLLYHFGRQPRGDLRARHQEGPTFGCFSRKTGL